MNWLAKLLRLLGAFCICIALALLLGAVAVYWHLAPQLPPTASLRDAQLQVPLRVLSAEGALLAEFGEKRRVPLTLPEVPDRMVQAVLASEDERFYEHPGVDWQGLTRAVVHLLRTGEKGPGGSTITMQVARNFFLGREKTYARKLNEILLALKIERDLSKDEILELYLNKIFLGHRAYGVGAAAEVYYGRPLQELSVAQIAMIAGLPKAPSRFNPIVNPVRAVERRNYVLGRMRDLGFISQDSYQQAASEPVSAQVHAQRTDVDADYVAEMARAWMEERYGEQAYSAGFRVVTTVQAPLQAAATRALRAALIAYDTRHGYRGAEQNGSPPASAAELDGLLAGMSSVGGLLPAVVIALDARSAQVHVKGIGPVQIPWRGLSWARRYIDENRMGPAPSKAADVVARGDLVRVFEVTPTPGDGEQQAYWRLAQIPEVEGALVALGPEDGRLLALVGGFDFFRSKFNRAIQAERQPGSSFKPFVYSAAIEYGFNTSSIVNDSPVVFDDPSLEAAWRPENYSGKFFGPTRLREALYKSRNLVSIRLLRSVGIDYTIDHLARFGFDPETLPRNLSLALGSGTVRPLDLAAAYAVLANGGFRVDPFFIARVEAADGEVVHEATPTRVCPSCDAPRVIAAENVWLMHSMMQDVIRRGTGTGARVLGRSDIAGKTGTTNDQRDAWFAGFNLDVVSTVWVGFDKLAPLGRKETGGRAALPAWVDFMRVALDGRPEREMKRPDGLVSARVDPRTGLLAAAGDPDAVFEFFHADRSPNARAEAGQRPRAAVSNEMSRSVPVTKQLF